MKRTTRFLALGAALLAMAALGQSCMTISAYEGAKPVPKSAYGDPSNSTLIYGSTVLDTGATLAFAKYVPLTVIFMQINTERKPAILSPGIVGMGKAFYLAPLPVGSSIKAFYQTYSIGRTTYLDSLGIQGRYNIDVKAAKPGLLYLGSLVYTDKDGTAEQDFYPIGTVKELDALKAMLPEFAGTAWEAPIKDRIKELSK